MWIVKLALDRPYTFIILALLILIMSPVVILADAHRYLPPTSTSRSSPSPGSTRASTRKRWKGG